MELLNKVYSQAAELFRSLTPGARIAAALLVVVALVSTAYLWHEQVSPGDTYLMGGEVFSAGQLRSMHAALGKAGLEARIDGARLKVPRGTESKSMAALAEAGALPIDFNGYLEKAVATSGLLALGSNQAAAIRIAKQRELQNIINTMVEKSAVLIDEQSDRGFPPKNIITASVSVQPRHDQPLDDTRIPAAIRYLVASSVAGLKPEAVTLVDLSTGRAYAASGDAEGGSSPDVGDYAQSKRYFEREYQQKISELLRPHIPGVLVTTGVELEGRAVQRVAVSVAVPASYYEQIWRQANPAADHQGEKKPDLSALADIQRAEAKKIEELVAPLLPQAEPGSEACASVRVSTFYQFPDRPTPPADFQSSALAWLTRNGNTLGWIGLALVGLLVLQSTVKTITSASTHRAAATMQTTVTMQAAEEVPAEEENGAPARLRRRAYGPSLRDELAAAVREDPESAVGVLRSWIGNPG